MTPAEALAAELGAPRGELAGPSLAPMLCRPDEERGRVLASKEFLFEPKLDGVRIIADKRGSLASLSYRRGRATTSYPEVLAAVSALPESRIVLDGEVVTLDASGKPSFQRLGTRIQARGKSLWRASRQAPVLYVVFDVLAIGDRDLRTLPLVSRKAVLARLIGGAPRDVLSRVPTFDDGEALARACRDRGLEGVIAKRRSAPYRSGERSPDWIKIKNGRDVDLVVVGYTEGEGKRARLGALDVASWDGTRFVARGSVGSGLDERVIDALLPRLRALEVTARTAAGGILPKRGRKFVSPEIVVSVSFLETSEDGVLRAPVFRGIRADVLPTECRLEEAVSERGESARAAFTREAAHLSAPWAADRLPGPSPSSITGERAGRPKSRAVDFVFVRTTGATAAETARAVRTLAERVGLATGVKTAGHATFDVVVAVGGAPTEGARALAALLVALAKTARPARAAEVRLHVEIPWSVLAGTHGEELVSLPVAWDEIDMWAARPATLARARRRLAAGRDPLAPLLAASPRFGEAAAALADLVLPG